jgi:N-acetylmuramoyl-L-alanine amidase CwlA
MKLDIKKKTSTVNTTVSKNRKIEYIVIHYTAGISSAKGKAASTATYFSKETTKASADFIVDDSTIVQYNPDIKNRYCWHCGGSKLNTKGGSFYKKCTNKNSIGIEICSNNYTGKIQDPNASSWYFTYGTVSNAEKLVVELMKEYDIPISNVIRHYDVTGKLCPGIFGWNNESGSETTWVDFKNSIAEAISIDTSTVHVNEYVTLKSKYNVLMSDYNELKEKYDAIAKIVNG